MKNPPVNAGDAGLIPDPGRSHALQSSYEVDNFRFTPRIQRLNELEVRRLAAGGGVGRMDT